jgi:hypothetical protein
LSSSFPQRNRKIRENETESIRGEIINIKVQFNETKQKREQIKETKISDFGFWGWDVQSVKSMQAS